MRERLQRWGVAALLGALLTTLLVPLFAFAQDATSALSDEPVTIYVFQRDDCTHCKDEKAFLADLKATQADLNFTVELLDIVNDDEANGLYQQLTTLKNLPRITPITIVGNTIIQGFDVPETTGERIVIAIRRAHASGERVTLEDVVTGNVVVDEQVDAACESGDVCLPGESGISAFSFKLPFVGVVDLRAFSLVTLSVVLGTIDGFNPCAMWVLVTFLLILLQVGDRKRMFQIAGLFILAEAVMYWLILNVWYSTWDFVGLDRIVTPLVGAIAIGGGLYFLYKYYQSRQALVCDVADIHVQGKIQRKINEIASAPLTIAAVAGIIGIALSVNIIEFACSVGIPQAFTKILELNQLNFWQTQGYTSLYILFYMLDDFVVFGLALWGSQKIHATEKYSRLSLLIGGILMLILGALLMFAPNALAF